MAKINRIHGELNHFIAKASKRNEPLESFRDTEAFTQFNSGVERAIQKQAAWVAKHLKDSPGIELEATDENIDMIVQDAGAWLNNNMPRLDTYISQNRIYSYLSAAFVWSVEAQYMRYGFNIQKDVKGTYVNFKLTNQYYIATLKAAADVLLHRSTADETTRSRLASIIREYKLSGVTIDELASVINEKFAEISSVRAFMIANTETNNAMSIAQKAFMAENGVKTKKWIPAGPSTCDVCEGNADDGEIPIDDPFSSGDDRPAAHPNCECYLEAGEIDLESIDIWTGQ